MLHRAEAAMRLTDFSTWLVTGGRYGPWHHALVETCAAKFDFERTNGPLVR